MTVLFDPAVLFLALVLTVDAFALALFFIGGARRRALERVRTELRRRLQEALTQDYNPPEAPSVRRWRRLIAREAVRMADAVALTAGQRLTLERLYIECGLTVRLFRNLYSHSVYRRSRAAISLSVLTPRTIILPLVKALERERRHPVKLFLAAALAGTGDPAALPTIIDTLKDSPPRFQRALWGIVAGCESGMDDFIPLLVRRREKEIKLLLIHLAGRQCSTLLCRYVERLTEDPDLDLAHAAFRVFSTAQAEHLDHRRFLVHPDFLIRNLAAESLGRVPRTRSLALLFDHLDDPVIGKSAGLAVTALIRARPHFLKIVIHRCLNELRPVARCALARVLAGFADYIMGSLASDNEGLAERVLVEFVKVGRTNEIINFLNRNTDAATERKILAVIRAVLEDRPDLSGDFLTYLDGRILGELGMAETSAPKTRPGRRESRNRPLLLSFLLLGACAGPAAALALAILCPAAGTEGTLRAFIHWFNSIFAWYALTLSFIYITLLLFSVRGAFRQTRFSALPGSALLFTENVLPSISIISPAHNEEATIVESVHALLNLRYPDYEIIVVNDGSSDKTLSRLVEAFKLERSDVFIHAYLPTQEIKAVYANKLYPELFVIDKINGGKADSLNAGINVARKEYFSGIDADSLLEDDALLNMASLFLFSEREVVAAGGNILPANGCTVKGGALLETRIPRTHLARFQTVEYLRAFMAGRVGWAELRLLLIISGAFGVFHRRSVVNAGGYLTQSGPYRKDTVGEDMELVVRLCRTMRENRLPFAMVYAHHANCWTEIPEKLNILVNQRDRWQRGLLDIICFHARLLFNPAYGRVGLVGFPYFLIFEVLGPWLELEGFLVFSGSIAAGWVSLPIAALLFAATVGLGLLMSVISVSIVQRRKKYFPLRDALKLFLYSICENFGIRQFLNFLRVRGLVRMLGRTEGWGKMERRGWQTAPRSK